MSKPTEFKYPLDENGEPYFAGSHVNAIEGMEDITDKLEKTETNTKNLEDSFKDFIGVTNWTSYANNVAPGVQTNTAYSSDGFKCEIKEVRIGVTGLTPIVRYKTITYNLRNFKLGEQVAQLPVGFMTKSHSFPAYGNGNMGAYRVEVTKSGAMTIFGGLNDKNLSTSSYWVYGQYTWIE